MTKDKKPQRKLRFELNKGWCDVLPTLNIDWGNGYIRIFGSFLIFNFEWQ